MRPARKGPENAGLVVHFNRSDHAFNEAGPQGAGKRRRGADRADQRDPSMRPARKGPENISDRDARSAPARAFNEAGPQGAGKPTTGRRSAAGSDSFNEAGPQGAGKRPRGVGAGGGGRTFNEAGPQGAGKRGGQVPDPLAPGPSMRPARKGPENDGDPGPRDRRRGPFNEAGPQGAGKPRCAGSTAGRWRCLQ